MEEEEEMSFLQHLEVLRWHLIRSIFAILVGAVTIFIAKSFVFDSIIFAPKNEDFITFRFLCWVSAHLANWLPFIFSSDTICIGRDLPQLQNIHMTGQFMTHILVSLVGGLIIAFPYLIWEVWRFIRPGLKKKEQRYAGGIVILTSLLFMTGVLFGYYVITPLSVNFFLSYSISSSVSTIPTLSTYISTVVTVVLACGFVFQLPNLVYFLAKAGIISAKAMRAYRKHAFVGALILSAVITPPDVFSQILVSLPLVVLYELSIFIARRIEKKAEDPQE